MWPEFEAAPRWIRDFVPLVALLALIFVLSSRPAPVERGREAADFTLYKIAHLVVYGVLTWLWWRALSPRREIGWPALLSAAALSVLYGVPDRLGPARRRVHLHCK